MNSQKTPPIDREGYISGFDVSHFQGVIDWAKVFLTGIRFAFIKATQGTTFKDKYFSANVIGAQSNGIKAYPYHFYNPGDDPGAQADNFINSLQTDFPQVIQTVAVDLEESGLNWILAPSDKDGSRLKVFLDRLTNAGLNVVLYVTPAFIAKWFPKADYLAAFARWIAKWSDTPPPGPWEFWQYSAYGQVDGIAGYVDLDYFNGAELPA